MFQFMTPWLFGAGAAAVSLPILIHLLNRRKFKIVDWAAMDFLLEANRRNRRRILLENLLLLLMRCLAIALLGLLLARPFMSSDSLSMLGMESVRVERIVLIDDSASMRVPAAGSDKPALEVAKEAVIKFAKRSAADSSDDQLTVRLASNPKLKVFEGYMTEENVDEIEQRVGNIQPSDKKAHMHEALEAIEESLVLNRDSSNYVIYIITDLRKADWAADQHVEKDKQIAGIIGRLAEKIKHKGESTARVVVLDVGSDEVDNLVISSIKPLNKTLVLDVESEFEVTVYNAGEQAVNDVEVELIIGEVAAPKQTIEHIDAQKSGVATFRYTFQDSGPVRVRAVLSSADRLPIDNRRHYAARVRDGRNILIVDGDPSSDAEDTESFFVQRALAPRGEYTSGNIVEVMAESEFETLDLKEYGIVLLCNVYKLTDERLASLEQWVAGGGGLFVTLGDLIDQDPYNEMLYNKGQGLLPIKLEDRTGDESHKVWANPVADALNHPVMSIFAGDLGTLTQFVKVFRWWSVSLSEDGTIPDGVTVVARWNDVEQSPALVEKAYGKGRVLVLTTSIDRAWNDWPLDDTFAFLMLDMVKYMARRTSDEGSAIVGLPIQHRMDSAKFVDEVELIDPSKEKVTLICEPDASGRTLELIYDKTERNGFYELQLMGHDSIRQTQLFAANIDPTEGHLLRTSHQELIESLGAENVTVQQGVGSLTAGDKGGWSELWKWILVLAVVVLCGEQLMAWAFGRRR